MTSGKSLSLTLYGFALGLLIRAFSFLTMYFSSGCACCYVNIGEHIGNLSAFIRLRDTNPVFDHMKAIGDVGVPAFVFEDGRVSIDPADAGLVEYGTPGACSLADHQSGRKGC